MTKFVIILNALRFNRGSEALVRGLLSIIKSEFRDSFITVISSEYGIEKEQCIENVDQYMCRFRYSSSKSLVRLLATGFQRFLHLDGVADEIKYGHLKQVLAEADHIIVVGADNYDPSYHMFNKLHSLNVYIRKHANGKIWLYDCSLEKNHINSMILKDFMLFDGITVRESDSFAALKDSAVSKKVYLMHDPAFCMPAEEYAIEQMMPEGDRVGINISNLILSPQYGGNSEIIYENYLRLIDYILRELKTNILLIPHVMGGADLTALRKIKEKYKGNEKVLLLDDEKISAPQLKYLISGCRFMITARTHASIAAYATCVPTLVLGYSIKSTGIARDLFGETEHYVVPIQNLKTDYVLLDAFRWQMKHEVEIKESLKKKMPSYIQNAQDVIKLFAD